MDQVMSVVVVTMFLMLPATGDLMTLDTYIMVPGLDTMGDC